MRRPPIFLLGCHKSGTSLLRSLFDGVDSYFVIPIETHCFQVLNYWISYPYRKQIQKKTGEQFLSNAVELINALNNSKDKYADNITANWFDEHIFKKTLSSKISGLKNDNDFIEVYFESIYASLNEGKNLSDNFGFIEKSVENAEFALDLVQLFPSARFIHIVRNPYSNIVSLRKYKSREGYPYLDIISKTLNSSFYYLFRNERLIENYKVIKYEDLVSRTEDVMRNLSNFVEVNFDKNLITPTVHGDIWKGNSTTDKKFEGVSDDRLEKWKENINAIEIAIVNRLFPHILKRFKYKKKEMDSNPYLKCPNENLKKYIVNRLFLARAEAVV